MFIREQQEIERILEELTTKVAQVKTEIEVNLEILAHLDFMFAKAKLSRDMNAICRTLLIKDRLESSRGVILY